MQPSLRKPQFKYQVLDKEERQKLQTNLQLVSNPAVFRDQPQVFIAVYFDRDGAMLGTLPLPAPCASALLG